MLFPENPHLSMMNNHYPAMVPHRHHTKYNKPKMALPCTKTPTENEPISLELFNRAATDLNEKGEIELNRYKKYLFN